MAKNYKLAQEADKDRVYGALKEFTKNPKLWHSSTVGREYSQFTVEGQGVITDMLKDILRTVDILERKAVDQHAREVVWEQLKRTDCGH